MPKTTFTCEEIKNVTIEKEENPQWISFQVGNMYYEISLKEHPLFYLSVYHKQFLGYKGCPYCEEASGYCSGLTHYKEEIFQHLITQPNIRLHWLLKEKTIGWR